VGDFHSSDELLALIARQKELNSAPGDNYLYCNSGYFLLAQIIERATGKSLRVFAEEHIFEPLGMKHTHFHDDRSMVVADRAMAYAPVGEDRFALHWDVRGDQVGAGGLLTTVEDLLLWDRNFDADTLAGGGIVEQMFRRGVLNNGEEIDYAFGLIHGDYGGLEFVYHDGGTMGFFSLWARIPEQRFSVILLCNVADPDALMPGEIADIYLEEHLAEEEAAAETNEGAKEAEPVKFIDLPEEALGRFEGGYRGAETGIVIKATHKDGALMVTSWDRGPIHQRQLPLSETRFRSAGGLAVIDVEFDDRGVMHMFEDGEKLDSFHPVELFAPTTEELNEFAGRYFSGELRCIYEFSVDGGKLALKKGRLPKVLLEPTVRDAFRVERYVDEQGRGQLQLDFFRDRKKRVTGFVAREGPIGNIRFQRVYLR
jgi:hypothetical protein